MININFLTYFIIACVSAILYREIIWILVVIYKKIEYSIQGEGIEKGMRATTISANEKQNEFDKK